MRAVRAEGWDTGECVFFLRGTMSNTEITEMNVKVLHVCVHMYFILLYLIVYIYN